jgi:hypothetical protein
MGYAICSMREKEAATSGATEGAPLR